MGSRVGALWKVFSGQRVDRVGLRGDSDAINEVVSVRLDGIRG